MPQGLITFEQRQELRDLLYRIAGAKPKPTITGTERELLRTLWVKTAPITTGELELVQAVAARI